MTDSHPPPGAMADPAAGQPPGGSRGTSPTAIASAACGAGGLILLGVSLSEGLREAPATAPPPVWLLAPLLGIGVCIAAFVLGVVALVQIRVRHTRRRGAGLALSGLILGGTMLPLLCFMFLAVGLAISCTPSSKCF
jgi:hypothetical protein